jgi:hypothetical protein
MKEVTKGVTLLLRVPVSFQRLTQNNAKIEPLNPDLTLFVQFGWGIAGFHPTIMVPLSV